MQNFFFDLATVLEKTKKFIFSNSKKKNERKLKKNLNI